MSSPTRFTVEAYAAHRDPTILTGPDDVDPFVDELLRQQVDYRGATLYVRERPANAAGFADHELYAGIDLDGEVGALTYLGPGGLWASVGARPVRVFYWGEPRDLPPDSAIALDKLRRAIREFLTTGGERPTCVDWQQF